MPQARAFSRRPIAFICVLGILTAVTVAVAMTDTRPATARARDWVRAHAASLPETLPELARYPVEYRLAIFQAVSVEAKSRLVRASLQSFIASEHLTTEQRGVVEKMIAIVTPDAYGARNSTARREMKPLCDEVHHLFTEDQRRLLGSLGPVFSDDGVAVRVARLAKRLVGVRDVYAGAAEGDSCTCAFDTWCPWGCGSQGQTCGLGYNNCQSTGAGCGCGLIWPCDGGCSPLGAGGH